MQDAVKQEALRESRKALDLMAKSVLSADEQQEVVEDCVTNFDRYVNPGILEYRKSVSTDYTAVEWSDDGCVYRDIHGKEYIDCLGGFGIYMLGHRHPTVVKAVRDQLEHQALHSQELLDPMRGHLAPPARHGHARRPAVLVLLQLGHRGQRGRHEARQAVRMAPQEATTTRASSAPPRPSTASRSAASA